MAPVSVNSHTGLFLSRVKQPCAPDCLLSPSTQLRLSGNCRSYHADAFINVGRLNILVSVTSRDRRVSRLRLRVVDVLIP